MATVTYIKETRQTSAAMKAVIDYCTEDEKVRDRLTDRRLVSGINCDGENAFREFMTTKNTYGKANGVFFKQYVQSFSPDENITAEKVHEIACEFAKKAWPGFEVLVATHSNADHLHSHFVINSVSFENGNKIREPKHALEGHRKLSDEICQAHGFSVLVPYEKGGAKLGTREYRSALKKESWKFTLMNEINNAMKVSGNRDEFIQRMNDRGYGVTFTDDRKNITYTCPNGMKCRDKKLHDDKFLKEMMENEFSYRTQITEKFYGSVTDGETGEQYRNNEADTLSADSIRIPAGTVGLTAYNVGGDNKATASDNRAERRTDDEGGTKRKPESVDEILRQALGEPDEPDFTGWEDTREDYFRWLLTPYITASGVTGYNGQAVKKVEEGSNYHRYLSNTLYDILYGVGSLASIIDENYYKDDCTTKNYTPHHSKEELERMMASGIKI